MAGLPLQASEQAKTWGIVLGLTAVWWACAVGVTVVLKAALGGTSSRHPDPDRWSFPYPLTLTLFANIGSAICTGLMAYLAGDFRGNRQRGSFPAHQEAEQFHAVPGTTTAGTPLFRASSREALLQEAGPSRGLADQSVFTPASAQGQTNALQPGAVKSDQSGSCGSIMTGGLLGGCGCWNPRRHALLERGMALPPEGPKRPQGGQPPGEMEMEANPESIEIISNEPESYPSYSMQQDSLGSSGGSVSSYSCPPWLLRSCRSKSALAAAALKERRTALIAMGVLQGLALGAKNEALLLLSVSTRTMIFATSVLVVMLLARIFGLERLKKPKIIAALLLASGGALQGVATIQQMREPGQSHYDEPQGYILAVVALVLDALRWVLLQAVFTQEPSTPSAPANRHSSDRTPDQHATLVHEPLSRGDESDSREGAQASPCDSGADLKEVSPKLSKLRMVSLVMWMTTPVCFLLSLFYEPAGMEQAYQEPLALLALVSLLTIGVMGINICEFGIVQWTSAVTFNVLSQLHGIPLVIAGVTFFGESITGVQVLGFLICLIGALLYSFVKAREKRAFQPTSGDECSAVEISVAAPLQPTVSRQTQV